MIDHLISKSKFKEAYENLFGKLIHNRISPNQITLLGLFFGLCGALMISLSQFIQNQYILLVISLILVIISFFFDTIDGVVARFKDPTWFGGILDIFCDRTVEISIIIGIISNDPELLWPGIFSLASIVLCITAFLSIGAVDKKFNSKGLEKVIFYSKGIMERSETVIFLIAMIILPFMRLILLWIFAILVFLTSLQRIRFAYFRFNQKRNGQENNIDFSN
ncbi:MAG: hypothetical protein GF317_21435 [Candidatus Lokiarchaeota archaeon]|nr:hypothetical protein [Candidatus Lokiarchaeota archaeon]MBD3202020.1 hypothetical protein [Candidatus Lokiarchaeota archaeon]